MNTAARPWQRYFTIYSFEAMIVIGSGIELPVLQSLDRLLKSGHLRRAYLRKKEIVKTENASKCSRSVLCIWISGF